MMNRVDSASDCFLLCGLPADDLLPFRWPISRPIFSITFSLPNQSEDRDQPFEGKGASGVFPEDPKGDQDMAALVV